VRVKKHGFFGAFLVGEKIKPRRHEEEARRHEAVLLILALVRESMPDSLLFQIQRRRLLGRRGRSGTASCLRDFVV